MAVRVLIVDDSAIIRSGFERELKKDPEIEVIGSAPDPYTARDKIAQLTPDVITLDIEMPKMDGITFLQKIMQHHPIPVIIVSSFAKEGSMRALEALRAGAVEVLAKPNGKYSLAEMGIDLREKVKAAAISRRRPTEKIASDVSKVTFPTTLQRYIMIGASTGGTQALESVLTRLPSNAPGIVIVQHMPQGFTNAFAERLNKLCDIRVKEAETGDEIIQGTALIAPGNYHLTLKRSGVRVMAEVQEGELFSGHRPSVDKLFLSAAEVLGKQALGVILTGMGKDGAQGMLKMRQAGSVTLGQDEASCIVYGMPKVAFEVGGVCRQVSLLDMPVAIAEGLVGSVNPQK